MITVIASLSILSAVAFIATVRALRVDGYHRVRTDHTRLP